MGERRRVLVCGRGVFSISLSDHPPAVLAGEAGRALAFANLFVTAFFSIWSIGVGNPSADLFSPVFAPFESRRDRRFPVAELSSSSSSDSPFPSSPSDTGVAFLFFLPNAATPPLISADVICLSRVRAGRGEATDSFDLEDDGDELLPKPTNPFSARALAKAAAISVTL